MKAKTFMNMRRSAARARDKRFVETVEMRRTWRSEYRKAQREAGLGAGKSRYSAKRRKEIEPEMSGHGQIAICPECYFRHCRCWEGLIDRLDRALQAGEIRFNAEGHSYIQGNKRA